MNVTAELYSQALGLPATQREELAILLLESLPEDDSPVEVSEELEQEINRRLAEHRAGTAKSVDVETFNAAVRAAAKRPATP
jgi:putative addiction module component (TIGR02574 family)